MRFRHLLALLLVVSVALLTGCGGGGGSSGGSSGTTITTRLLMPSAPAGSLRGSVKGQTAGTVTGATVTLTMADGTTYTMRDNGNGEYSATVTEIPGAGGFYIEAHKGDLELQNLFTSLPEDLNAITTDYLSTTFTQVALAFAQNADYGGGVQFASATALLSNVANISIEFNQLRTEVTDETNVTYTQTRTMFQAALADADTTQANTSETLLDKLASGDLKPVVGGETLSWTNAISKPIIQDGTITPPAAAPADDEAAIKTAASTLLTSIAKFYSKTALTQTEIASISGVLSDRFVHRGMTKAILLNQLAQGVSETDNLVLDHFEGDMVLRKINDTTYAVGPVGTVYEKDRDGNIAGHAEDSFKFGYDLSQRAVPSDLFPTTYRSSGLDPDEMFPLLVAKETGGWKVIGNGIKVDEIWLNLTNRYEPKAPNPASRTNFWFNVKDTEAFPVKSVTISGTHLPQLSLAKNPDLADSNTWHYWRTDTYTNASYPTGYPVNEGWDSSVKHSNGDKYTFVVTFTDNTTQTFEHTVANLPSNWTSLNAAVTPGSTSVTATWTANPWNDFENYYINVQNMNVSGDNRILEKDIGAVSNTTFSFDYQTSSYTLSSGAQIGVNIESHNKWGFSSSYWTYFNIP